MRHLPGNNVPTSKADRRCQLPDLASEKLPRAGARSWRAQERQDKSTAAVRYAVWTALAARWAPPGRSGVTALAGRPPFLQPLKDRDFRSLG